jgi:anti-anti-sigma factor
MAVECRGPVLAVSFGSDRDSDAEATNDAIAEKLFELAGRAEGRTLQLSLGEVPFLSSGMLGKFVALHKRLRAVGGTLALCDLNPAVREQLCRTRLDRILNVTPPESPALLAGPV